MTPVYHIKPNQTSYRNEKETVTEAETHTSVFSNRNIYSIPSTSLRP